MTALSITTRRRCRRPRTSRSLTAAVALASLAAAALGACAPTTNIHGHRLDEAALAGIEPGQTTRQQVVQILGSPSATGTFNGEAWYYISQRTEHRSFYQNDLVAQDVVAITFNDQGVVEALDRHGLEEARSIDPVARATPTAGNELGLIEQLIGNVGRFDDRDADAAAARVPGRSGL